MPENLETILDRYLVGTLASVDLLYQKVPDYDPDVTPTVDLALSLTDLAENDLTLEGHSKSIATYYKEFLKALLGDQYEDHDLLNSVVGVRFKNEALDFVTRPMIAMVEGYPTLIIGADIKGEDTRSFKFPLEILSDGITVKGSAIKRLTISSLEVQKADQSKIKIPIVCFSVNKTVYAIHVSANPDVTFYELQEAWQERDAEKLGQLIATPYGAVANLNSIFTNLMESGSFPVDGIVLPLTGLAKSQRVKKDGGKFWTATYKLDTSQLPSIVVSAYHDGENRDDVPLDIVVSISCYQADRPLGQNAFTDKADKNPPSEENPWYLHVKGKDPKKKTPIHVVFQDTLSSRCKSVLERQQSLSYFPMPVKTPAINTKTVKG